MTHSMSRSTVTHRYDIFYIYEAAAVQTRGRKGRDVDDVVIEGVVPRVYHTARDPEYIAGHTFRFAMSVKTDNLGERHR